MTQTHTSSASTTLQYSLLHEPLIRYRCLGDGSTVQASLPELYVAMAANDVRDFPALRPHQRHPWHAFLTQLAAIAIHHAGRDELFETAQEWTEALLALTPDDPDGAAWCLVSPPDRPAVLQPAVPSKRVDEWKSHYDAADELDMLVTSKNHDLKASRSRGADLEEWLFALISLQTQEGFLGSGNYGISRMNGGFASRPGVGITIPGAWGSRWAQDVGTLLTVRDDIARKHGLQHEGGRALLWLQAWDGTDSLAFASLDPLYIEICRRVRLFAQGEALHAISTGSKVARVAAKELNGMTGDPWTPIDTAAAKALTIGREGFHYILVSKLLFGSEFTQGAAQTLPMHSAAKQLQFIARGVARGQGKTEGYHERHVPISPKVRSLLVGAQRAQAAQIAKQRIDAIGDMRKLLWLALAALFNNGVPGKDNSESVKAKTSNFSHPFEQAEDARFFADLTEEVEAPDPAHQRLQWLLGLAERAEAVLRAAFKAGPRSAMQRYRAQSAALSRFRGALRGPKSPLPDLANHYRMQAAQRLEDHDEHIEQA